MLDIVTKKSPKLFTWMKKWLSNDDTAENMIQGYKLVDN